MIGVVSSYQNHLARDLVLGAVRRSVSRSMAELVAPADMEQRDVLFGISPCDRLGESLLSWLRGTPRKLIMFGDMPTNFIAQFGATAVTWPEPAEFWARSSVAKAYHSAESLAHVCYQAAAKPFGAADWSRALERFDFRDEWNNLGFGAIRVDQSIWALATKVRVPKENELAQIVWEGEVIASYAALFQVGDSSVLWVNRPVGSIDSFEWRLVEYFLAHWQKDILPCVPVISEIPLGYDAAITMRLDCDEDIMSARPLWEAYRGMGVPLSLAIHTNNLYDDVHNDFLREFCDAGGALMSHTATHAPNFGGSHEAALAEGLESRDRIFAVTGVSVDYAVSPFHQAPHYALQGLCDAGYKGCIGGIIRNDPEFLMARGGELAGLPQGFVGHSQQTMLHGDCMLAEGDPLAVFKMAFDRAVETRTLFGYLDHPFSGRYTYGWVDEEARVEAHRKFIAYMRQRSGNPWFIDEVMALNFLSARSAICLSCSTSGINVSVPNFGNVVFAVEYKGSLHPLKNGTLLG